ncbi:MULTISPECIES: NADP-dependent malic enzyme [Chitinophagaceae]
MSNKLQMEQALEYHASGRPGKIAVVPTKETKTQRDLSLAYSPGVAVPCRAIAKNKEDVYKYTAKGNLVAVISNGTAVLGLGDIGPEAGKPVMEGKGVLFKIFADIDVFDIEIAEKDPEKFVQIVKALEPTFGGINLEDIKAPECFYIEKHLKEQLNIPVMHDDQHGTAIISAAALVNALEIQDKKIEDVRLVVSGAGAAAMACVQMYEAMGADPANFTMFDIEGVLHKGRTDLDPIKQRFSIDNANVTLADAMKGADVFLGLSAGNLLSQDMVKTMAPKPIVFAMANPDPEITYEAATEVRDDIIMATGRTDYPNQVNNVLGFPYIFRGALDVRATAINEEMKKAAALALAELAKTPVPDIVTMAYERKQMSFGPEYIIPKPLDPRLLSTIAPAVAKAAIESGVAQAPITDWEAYTIELNKRLGLDNQLLRIIGAKARKDPKRIVFVEADNIKILKAASISYEEGICFPILLGPVDKIKRMAEEEGIEISEFPIINPADDNQEETRNRYGVRYYEKRQRKGSNKYESTKMMRDRNHYGAMMVEMGDADSMISGLTRKYASAIRPALTIIGTGPGVKRIAGMYIVLTPKGPLFMADTTINLDPTAEELADITLLVAKEIQSFNITPKIAMISHSNFGSTESPEAKKMARATQLVKERQPDLIIDGEMQAWLPFDQEVMQENYDFSSLVGQDVNTLIFPNLTAGNAAYNLLNKVGGCDLIGPILVGLDKPVHVLQLGSDVRSIINTANIAVIDAQMEDAQHNRTCQEGIKNAPYWNRLKEKLG